MGGVIQMDSRRFLLLQRYISVGCSAPRSPFWWLHIVLQTTESAGLRNFSSVAKVQEADASTMKWHGLPPVPKQVRRWTASELTKAKGTLDESPSDHGDEKHDREDCGQQITALRWVTKCCPNLPNSLLQKLFRLRQVRKRDLLPSSSELPSITSDIGKLETRMRRVSVKALLEEGTILYLPKSVFQSQAGILPEQTSKKTHHQSTADEITWLQSLVLHKVHFLFHYGQHRDHFNLEMLDPNYRPDPEILVINKPPGLPVQGGTEVKKSLDSLMSSALSFDYNDGPRLVHRLDKETSGIMILARTQECAMLLHAFFREKTATATETKNPKTSIERFYQALVIGTPKQPQGRITVPLIKIVVGEGSVDKIMVAHDISSENAQFAITDYKVIGASFYGCTWLELHPLTGRKHQLRVHCAEVLGTPVLGDMKYGWRTHKEWLKTMKSQDSEHLAFDRAMDNTSAIHSRAVQHMKITKGSILAKVPLLHLHCRQMALPNISQMLERDRSRLDCKDVNFGCLQFVAPLPPHMAASRDLWAHNSPTAS